MKVKKKLIEVALPLDAINTASAREKSIRHGHPSTLHLWWARRPLATARAVIFAQMVDDPSGYVDVLLSDPKKRRAAERAFKKRVAGQAAKRALARDDAIAEPRPTLEEVIAEQERDRLFAIIEELVLWENTTNEEVLEPARREIWQSWRRACAENAAHPRAAEMFDRHTLPAFHDPFAGGGALPLEAQRLGLEAHASDLNPVAVLINKAMIEIPPKFAGQAPVNPATRQEKSLIEREWKGAQGLAEDVRYYGQWMREEAEKRIGHLYPKVEVTAEMVAERSDLKRYKGRKLTVIAWLWARTVKSPNPAFADVEVPLASTFMLSTKKGKEAYVEPVIEGLGYRFTVKVGPPPDPAAATAGTKLSRGSFRCLISNVPIWEQDAYALADSFDDEAKRYRGLRGGHVVPLPDADAPGLLVKPDIARQQLDAERAQPPSGGEVAGAGTDGESPVPGGGSGSGEVPATPPVPRPTRFHGTAALDSERVGRDASRIADEVIAHLSGLGAKVTVTLEIEAEVPAGAPDHVVRTVTENSRTLKFTSQGFEKE